MKSIRVSRIISAPLDLVFETISDVRNFRHAVPHITNVEFLSDQQTGVGTCFLETRVMKGREQTVELEVTEYVKNERVRMVSDAGGTIWDTLFTVSKSSDNVEMIMHMEIKPYKFFAKMFTPLIRRMVANAVESDMDSVKVYCESSSQSAE